MQTDRPTLGPCSHRRRLLRAEVDLRVREDLCGTGRVQGQVASQELHSVTRGPQPGEMWLLGPARGDQLRSRGIPEIATLSTSWQSADRTS